MKTLVFYILHGKCFNAQDFFIRQLAASGIDLFGLKYIEDQSLHCTLKLGIWRVPFDRLESSPDDVIDGSG